MFDNIHQDLKFSLQVFDYQFNLINTWPFMMSVLAIFIFQEIGTFQASRQICRQSCFSLLYFNIYRIYEDGLSLYLVLVMSAFSFLAQYSQIFLNTFVVSRFFSLFLIFYISMISALTFILLLYTLGLIGFSLCSFSR